MPRVFDLGQMTWDGRWNQIFFSDLNSPGEAPELCSHEPFLSASARLCSLRPEGQNTGRRAGGSGVKPRGREVRWQRRTRQDVRRRDRALQIVEIDLNALSVPANFDGPLPFRDIVANNAGAAIPISGLVITSQNSRSRSTRRSGRLPAISAPLMPPIDVPQIQLTSNLGFM